MKLKISELSDYEFNIEKLDQEINLSELSPELPEVLPTASGRNFAVSGGVAESVKVRLNDPSILRPAIINGLNKNGMKTLAMYGKINDGSLPTPPNCPNLIEVMACEGGCIAGNSTINSLKTAFKQVSTYGENSKNIKP